MMELHAVLPIINYVYSSQFASGKYSMTHADSSFYIFPRMHAVATDNSI